MTSILPCWTFWSRYSGFEQVNSRDDSEPEIQSVRSTPNKVSSCFKSALTCALTSTGCIGISVSSSLLHSLLWRVTHTCYQAEMKNQAAFNECNQPFISSLILYHSILVISSIILGYAIQNACQIRSSKRLHQSGIEYKESVWGEKKKRVQGLISYLQTNYSYEFFLLLGYLYNGIGIKVTSPATFHDFLVCTAVAAAIGGSVLGMYARHQWTKFKKLQEIDLNLTRFQIGTFLKNHWKVFSLSALVVGGTSVESIWKIDLPRHIRNITWDVTLVTLGWPIGYFLWDIAKSKNSSLTIQKIQKKIQVMLNCHNLFLFTGYFFYFFPLYSTAKYIGLSLLGFAQSLQDAQLEAKKGRKEPIFSSPNSDTIPVSRGCINKTVGLIQEYWKTIAVIAFSIALAKIKFLDCDGPPTPLNFTCPIGLETSVYVAGNQVIIDSKGANIAIITGLSHYYIRKFSKVICSWNSERFKNFYVAISDRCQYLLLSLIPYSLAQSGHHAEADNDFYSLNPFVPLVLIGLTFGTYKEQRHAALKKANNSDLRLINPDSEK